jgi:hypothetical protein
MFKELSIMELFFESPSREFNVREAARLLKIAPATASKILKVLSRKGLLISRKYRRFNLYKSNLDSDFYRDLKVFWNTRRIKESGLIESLNLFYLKPTIILFGSASVGIDTETSDFDIVIISEKTKEFADREIFEKKLKRKLQLFAVRGLKDLRNEHLINNVLNGITLQGGIKWA